MTMPHGGPQDLADPADDRPLTYNDAGTVYQTSLTAARDLGAGQARRRLAHRLLPQQPRQLRRRLPGTGRLPSGGAARTRIQTGSRAVAAVVAIVVAQVKRYGMAG